MADPKIESQSSYKTRMERLIRIVALVRGTSADSFIPEERHATDGKDLSFTRDAKAKSIGYLFSTFGEVNKTTDFRLDQSSFAKHCFKVPAYKKPSNGEELVSWQKAIDLMRGIPRSLLCVASTSEVLEICEEFTQAPTNPEARREFMPGYMGIVFVDDLGRFATTVYFKLYDIVRVQNSPLTIFSYAFFGIWGPYSMAHLLNDAFFFRLLQVLREQYAPYQPSMIFVTDDAFDRDLLPRTLPKKSSDTESIRHVEKEFDAQQRSAKLETALIISMMEEVLFKSLIPPPLEDKKKFFLKNTKDRYKNRSETTAQFSELYFPKRNQESVFLSRNDYAPFQFQFPFAQVTPSTSKSYDGPTNLLNYSDLLKCKRAMKKYSWKGNFVHQNEEMKQDLSRFQDWLLKPMTKEKTKEASKGFVFPQKLKAWQKGFVKIGKELHWNAIGQYQDFSKRFSEKRDSGNVRHNVLELESDISDADLIKIALAVKKKTVITRSSKVKEKTKG